MRVFGLIVLGASLIACVEDRTGASADGPLAPPGVDRSKALGELTRAEVEQLCATTNLTQVIGSVERLCEVEAVIGAVEYFEYGEQADCEQQARECTFGYEASVTGSCERTIGVDLARCDATVGEYVECIRARSELLRAAIGPLICTNVEHLGYDDLDDLYAALDEADRHPACGRLYDACGSGSYDDYDDYGYDYGYEPEPAEPEAPAVFDTLLLFDDGVLDNGDGLAGADFCGVSTDCAVPISATLTMGDGMLCEAEGPGCSTDRTDANAVLDDGSSCDAANLTSDFVSIGLYGSIFVEFDAAIAGCNVMVVEYAGDGDDPWSAFVCDSTNLDRARCVNNDNPIYEAPTGGSATFVVPAE